VLFKITLAMLAFSANSVLCRLALAQDQIDPMSFSILRVVSGIIVLILLFFASTYQKSKKAVFSWNVKNGFYLATYIVAFSLAYVKIDAGIGALLLFGTVQLTMLAYGILQVFYLRRISIGIYKVFY